MRKRHAAVLAIVSAMAMSSIAWASEDSESKPSKPQVLHQWKKRPKSERVVKRFVPTGSPSSSYVQNVIIPYEAERYGTSPIYDRVECESTYNHAATNGTYNGLIQTNYAYWGPAWGDVLAEGDLGVTFKTKKRVARGVYRVRLWDNGKKTFNRIAIQHVRRVIVQKGRLPKDATEWHGWAAIRVGTRAVAGVGPTTYWACTHNGSHY